MSRNVDFKIQFPTLIKPYLGQMFINIKTKRHFKPTFCGLNENIQKFCPGLFGSREITKIQSVQSISGHPV